MKRTVTEVKGEVYDAQLRTSLLVRRASAAYARRLSFVVASSCSCDDRGFESFSISLRVRSILIALLIAFVEV